MQRRIYGVETEFGVTCTFHGQRRLSPDEVARYLFRRVVSWGRSSNVFLRNGARLYLDVGSHPEYATAECDSLAQLVESSLALDPLSGHLFVFRSRRGDRIKILYWDWDGYALWYKRLERGTFPFPTATTACERSGVEVKAADLMMILDGVDLGSVRRQRRYCRETVENPR